jgi:tRNA dimethylallyltransferase
VTDYRALLHERLAQRFQAMMAAGFLEEVRGLRDRGDLTVRQPAMRAVGYRQLWGHLDGEYDLGDAVKRGVAATRQLAKRQLTWMRSEKSVQPIDPLRIEPLSWIRDTRARLAGFGF